MSRQNNLDERAPLGDTDLHDRLQRAESRIDEVIARLLVIESERAIERLLYQYGFMLDNRMWLELVDLFADEEPYIEIGQRGRYVGKEQIRRFFLDVLGRGRWGLQAGEVINHIQVQPVVTLSADGLSARVRSRAMVQGGKPGGSTFLNAEGIYENEFVRVPEGWRIKGVWWAPTFYVEIPGWDAAAFDSDPIDDGFPPDTSPTIPHADGLGRRFVPFHYPHPTTGEPLATPASDTSGNS